jgi:hypothetical protein
MTVPNLPQAIAAFITSTNAHDADAILATFAPGATVADDGKTHGTEAEIRAWIASHLIEPRIVITPKSYADGRLVASGDGDFPGGPLDFAFDFETHGDAITSVSIAPA